ncbi:hypothetical protein [Viridibacillus arvi]|uniref:hypothetical protein n=1 Tax=Viridibacillus arvi TaxID=263475 RepID=UPI003D060A0F
MKKIGLLILSISFIFLLAACLVNNTRYEAKASDFETPGFENKNNHGILVYGDDLMIIKHEPKGKTNSIVGQFDIIRYKNVKIKTKKDTYHITADDGVSLKFKKIGNRTIVDEHGVEYYWGAKAGGIVE